MLKSRRFFGRSTTLGVYFNNAQCPSNMLDASLDAVPEVKALLIKAAAHFDFSMRGFYRVARVALTIADLEGEPRICPRHMTQALSYRTELMSLRRTR